MSDTKNRPVTEQDLRLPAYRDVKNLDELEIDGFGAVMRKDRYQTAVQSLGYALYDARSVIWFVDTLKEDLTQIIYHIKNFDFRGENIQELLTDPKSAKSHLDHLGIGEHPVTLLLNDGSLLRGGTMHIEDGYHLRFSWRGKIFSEDVLAMRMSESEQPVLALIQDRESFIGSRTLGEKEFRQKLEALRTEQPRIAPPGGFFVHKKS